MLYLDIMVNTKTPVSLLFGVTAKKESHFWQSLTIPATNHRCKQILHTDRRACGFLLACFLFSIWLPFNDFQKLWHRSCPSVFSVWDFQQYPATFLSLILKYVKPYKQQLTREKPTGGDEQGKKHLFNFPTSTRQLEADRGERRAKGMIHSRIHWLIKPTISALWKHCALVRYYQPMFFLARVCHIPPW